MQPSFMNGCKNRCRNKLFILIYVWLKTNDMKKILFSLVVVLAFTAASAQTDSLQQYVGKYKFPDGSPVTEITVTVEKGLLMAGSAMGSTEFKPTSSRDVFEIVAYGGTATFRKKEGKVTSVFIQVGDTEIEGTKTEGIVLTTAFVLEYSRALIKSE